MIPGAGRAWRLVAWLWGPWLIAALSAPSHAQTAPQAPPAPAPTYQDRYIAGGTLSPDLSTEGYGTSETGGLARSDRKSTRLNSSHSQISYAVFCLKKKKNTQHRIY